MVLLREYKDIAQAGTIKPLEAEKQIPQGI